MPQWRKLWVKTVDSFDVNDLPDDFTRLAWVILPLGLDRDGRGLDNAAWLRSQLFKLREDVDNGQMAAAMDAWQGLGMIERYQVNGRAYFCVPSFYDYQGNTSKETESRIPPPPDWVVPSWQTVQESAETSAQETPEEDAPEVESSQEEVKSKSGVSPDQDESESGVGFPLDTDAEADVDSDSETDSDVEATADAEADAEADADRSRGPPLLTAAADNQRRPLALARLKEIGIGDPKRTNLAACHWVTVPYIDQWWAYVQTWDGCDQNVKISSMIRRMEERRKPPVEKEEET